MPSFFVGIRDVLMSVLVDPSLKTGSTVTDFHTFILVCLIVITMVNFATVASFFVMWIFRKGAKMQIKNDSYQRIPWNVAEPHLMTMEDEIGGEKVWRRGYEGYVDERGGEEEEEQQQRQEERQQQQEEEEEEEEIMYDEIEEAIGPEDEGIRRGRATIKHMKITSACSYDSVFDWEGSEKLDDTRFFSIICRVENKTKEEYHPPPNVKFAWGTEDFDNYGLVFSVVSLHHITTFKSLQWDERSRFLGTKVTRSLWESIKDEDKGQACIVALFDNLHNTIHGLSKQEELLGTGEPPCVAWRHSHDGVFSPVIVHCDKHYDDKEDVVVDDDDEEEEVVVEEIG